MDLNFVGNDLYKGFNLVSGIVPTTAMKQVLKGVRVQIRDKQAVLTATDLEVLVRYVLPLDEDMEECGIVLPATRVNNILREWTGNEKIQVSIEKNNCVLKSKGGYFRIVGEDSQNFPGVQAADVKGFAEVDGKIISDMVGKVVYAVSAVKARSTLCGVFVRVIGDDIIMAAADGNRLATVKRKVNNVKGVSMEGIVSVKCLTFLQRFVSEYEGALKVGISESQIQFLGENGEVLSQLIEGQYPKYEDVIPRENDKKVEVKRDELLSAVKMASFMTSEGYRVVKFIFRKAGLTLVSKTADIGETELEIAAVYDGPDMEISFNPDYILDVLRVSDSETIAMEFKDGNSAALFRTGHEQLNVVMPVELK